MNRIINKLTSGQWILTVAFAFTFAYLGCSGKLETKEVMTIGGVIVYAYFTRDRKTGKDENDS